MSNHSVDSIFIVDDDPQELLLLQRLLEIQIKMPVIAASSGSEALSLFAHEAYCVSDYQGGIARYIRH